MGLLRRSAKPEALRPPDPDECSKQPIETEQLVVLGRPRSRQAEQFRRLASSLEALNPDGAPRTVMLTSSTEREGVSVATLNLALAFRERPGVKVLVVDANLRRPGIEDYLDMPRRQGLSELLRDKLRLDKAIRRTSLQGFDVVGAGELPENPSQVLRGDRLRTLFGRLKQQYDYVLVDTPPAHTLTEPHLIGAVCDGIVLVVKMRSTARHLVEETSSQLESMGGNLLGVCLVGVPEE
ncbi:MAG: CpsD/CapB family tyrosine-protein kinase [Planctomycetota bacterium]